MKISSLYLCRIFPFLSANHPTPKLLRPPGVLSPVELQYVIDRQGLDMCWFCQGSYFHFKTKGNDVFLEVMFVDQLPEYWLDHKECFTQEEKLIEGKQRNTFRFTYGTNRVKSNTSHDPNASSYLVSERRILKNAQPTRIQEEDLVSIIQNKRVLFYTGAGLSAEHVPCMKKLKALLGIEYTPTFLSIQGPLEALPEKIMSFHQSCFSCPPTSGHIALKDIALFKGCQIVTENLDILHEQSGIQPYRVNVEELKTEENRSSFKDIDYIICVGLSYDDRGFLGYFKKNNPEGKILSIDLSSPSYLGNDDYWLPGDLQEILPRLCSRIISQ